MGIGQPLGVGPNKGAHRASIQTLMHPSRVLPSSAVHAIYRSVVGAGVDCVVVVRFVAEVVAAGALVVVPPTPGRA